MVSLGDDLAEARREFLDDPRCAPPGMRGIVVNEFAFFLHDLLPAENLGFLYHREEGGVLRGARACWGTCFEDSLDGIITPDTKEPRAVWWAFRAYADGVDSRVASASNDRQIVPIASRAGADPDFAQVLIGHSGVAVDRPPAEVAVTLRGLEAVPGPSGSPAAYVYRDRRRTQGPCRAAILRPGLFDLTCRGEQLQFTLDEDAQQHLAVTVEVGTASLYCMEFGGRIRHDSGTGTTRTGTGAFLASNAPPPAACGAP